MLNPKEICEDVKRHRDEVLDDWRDLLEERPWLELPENISTDHLPELVVALADAAVCAYGEQPEDPRLEVIRYALKHGAHREKEGHEDHTLFQEFHLLREAIWTGLRRRHPLGQERTLAISLLDSTIASATRASLHGFHRGEDSTLARHLVEECVWPGEHMNRIMDEPDPSDDGGTDER